MLKRRRPDKPAAVMFFALDLALAALPELGPRTGARAARAAARPGDAAAAQPRGPLPAGLRDRSATRSGCACPRGRRRSPRWPTSAGRSCSPAPTSPAARTRAGSRTCPSTCATHADLVLDGGELPGTPSTVVDLRAYEADGDVVGRARRRHVRRGGRRAARVRAVTTSAFVTGGSGFIGGALVRRLVADGWTVRALARSDASADVVRERGAEPVARRPRRRRRDDRGRRRLPRSPSTAAAHLGDWGNARGLRARQRARARATRWPPRARPACGASSTSAPRPRCSHGEPLVKVDERAPLRFDSPALYSATKARAEEAVIEANSDGLETVVVRPRFVWGLGDTTLLPAMTEMVRAGRFAWIGGGRQRTSTTHVDNVVEGLMLGAAAGRAGRRLLRHRRRAGGLPRLRHPPDRDPGRDAARPLAAGARRQRGRTVGETAWRAPAAPRPPAADAPGRLAVRSGDARSTSHAHAPSSATRRSGPSTMGWRS